MLNLKIAVALYCYKELNEYEAVYEASANKIAGLHLYESLTKNWRNLPSPNYDRLWTSEYDNTRERARNNRIREIFDKALEYRLIRLEEKTRRYICYYGDHVDLREEFARIEQGINEKTFSAPQARAQINELNRFLTNPAREKFSTPLFDTEFLVEENRPDNEYAKGVFIYMPALNEKIAAEVAMRDHIEWLRSQLVKIDQSEIKYSHFAQALYMGSVFKRRKQYKYAIDDVEHILYTMQNINDLYVDYDIFQAYLGLSDEVSTYLQKKAQDTENSYTDEQYVKLIKDIEKYIQIYRDKLEQLEKAYQDERDGSQKRLFYREMLDVFVKEKAVLS